MRMRMHIYIAIIIIPSVFLEHIRIMTTVRDLMICVGIPVVDTNKEKLDALKNICKEYTNSPEYVYKACFIELPNISNNNEPQCLVVMKKLDDTKTNETRNGVVDANFAKFRADKLHVVLIIDMNDISNFPGEAFSRFMSKYTQYKVGHIVCPDSFDPDIDDVCTNGIHFFKTVDAAYFYCRKKIDNMTTYYQWYDDGQKATEQYVVQLKNLNTVSRCSSWDGHGVLISNITYINNKPNGFMMLRESNTIKFTYGEMVCVDGQVYGIAKFTKSNSDDDIHYKVVDSKKLLCEYVVKSTSQINKITPSMLLIDQQHFRVDVEKEEWKFETLCDMLTNFTISQIVVFVECRETANWLVEKLIARNLDCETFHEETKIDLETFQKSKTKCLILTDSTIFRSHNDKPILIINYDVPQNMITYCGRIDRCNQVCVIINYYIYSRDMRMMSLLDNHSIKCPEMPPIEEINEIVYRILCQTNTTPE